eukprot:6167540-Prymnesium_polylepis.1
MLGVQLYGPNTFSSRPQSVRASDLTDLHQTACKCVSQSRHTAALAATHGVRARGSRFPFSLRQT